MVEELGRGQRPHRPVRLHRCRPHRAWTASGLAVLQNAVANDARIDIVNIMTFDYYDDATHEMAHGHETAADGLVDQLQHALPGEERRAAVAAWSASPR